MGIDVRLEDEDGNEEKVILDPNFKIEKLLPELKDTSSCCLRFVDPYGDTMFNSLQMPTFISELENAIDKVVDPESKEIGREILKLAKICKTDQHQYLKFYGD